MNTVRGHTIVIYDSISNKPIHEVCSLAEMTVVMLSVKRMSIGARVKRNGEIIAAIDTKRKIGDGNTDTSNDKVKLFYPLSTLIEMGLYDGDLQFTKLVNMDGE